MASDDKLSITDTLTNEQIDSIMLINNEGIIRWRIKTGNRRGNGYRYFDQKDIDTCLIRRKIAQTPIEVLQKRNNVEATVFQVGYHYPNDKTRYRGLVKHQMWANIRCFWVNFVRIINFIEKTTLKTAFFAIMRFAQRISMSFHSLFDTLTTICLSGYLLFQKNQYSCF